jgi:hypothetical protein
MKDLLKEFIDSVTRFFTKKNPAVLYVRIKRNFHKENKKQSNRKFKD